MRFFSAILVPAALLTLLPACASLRGPKLDDLNKQIESFHKDLIFQRYTIAAKSITPALRADYLENINRQQLRFAEIEALAMEPCIPGHQDCIYVTNQVQWYAGHSPVVSTTMVTEKWLFDEQSSLWIMVEQEERSSNF